MKGNELEWWEHMLMCVFFVLFFAFLPVLWLVDKIWEDLEGE